MTSLIRRLSVKRIINSIKNVLRAIIEEISELQKTDLFVRQSKGR